MPPKPPFPSGLWDPVNLAHRLDAPGKEDLSSTPAAGAQDPAPVSPTPRSLASRLHSENAVAGQSPWGGSPQPHMVWQPWASRGFRSSVTQDGT